MSEQSNAELIAEAKSRAELCDADTREAVRDTGNIVARLAAALEAADRRAEQVRRAEQAEARLADVIEWAASVSQEEEYPTFDAGWEEAALHVLDIARGEANERESNDQ